MQRFGKKRKLNSRFVGYFDILKKVSTTAYMLALPPKLSHVHNVFHVNLLKLYIPNSDHILSLDGNILVTQEEFQIEPEQILRVKEK